MYAPAQIHTRTLPNPRPLTMVENFTVFPSDKVQSNEKFNATDKGESLTRRNERRNEILEGSKLHLWPSDRPRNTEK